MQTCTTVVTPDCAVCSKYEASRERRILLYFVQAAGPGRGPQSRAPGSSLHSSKHFPGQRSNHLPNDRPLGAQTQGQVQSRVLWDAGREQRGENEGNTGKKGRDGTELVKG